MKSIRQLIMSGIAAIALTAVTSVFAGSQTYTTSAGPNQGKNESFYFSVPATCSISSSVVFTNPNQPFGGGGGGVTVTLVNIQTVYTFGYGSNMAGSASRSATGQAAGTYKIDQSASAGGTGAYATATTTFTW